MSARITGIKAAKIVMLLSVLALPVVGQVVGVYHKKWMIPFAEASFAVLSINVIHFLVCNTSSLFFIILP